MRNLILIVFICFFDFLTFAYANPFEVGLKHYKDNNCFDENGFPSRNKDNYIVEECAPDTLFRWGWSTEVSKILESKNSWDSFLEKPMFTSFSPLSTYPYSNGPYRFKVKKGVKFKMIEPTGNPYQICLSKKDELKNTILVRKSYSIANTGIYSYAKDWIFWEYNFCSLNVFESISRNQKLAYDEMIIERDYTNKLVKDKNLKNNLVLYIHQSDGTPIVYMEKKTPDGQEILGMDGHFWNKEVLALRLEAVQRGINKGELRFFINPEFANISKEEMLRRHFLTDKPTYWNWKTEKSKEKIKN